MGSLTMNPLFRSESFGYYYPEHNYSMIERRQVFLRSYQFSRKKSLSERIKSCIVHVKKVVWLRLRSIRRFKCAFYYRRIRELLEDTDMGTEQIQLLHTSAQCQLQLSKILEDSDLDSIIDGITHVGSGVPEALLNEMLGNDGQESEEGISFFITRKLLKQANRL